MSNKEALKATLFVFVILLVSLAISVALVVLERYIPIWILLPIVVFVLSFAIFKFMKY